jgi:uncharacterized repeat protein (TIGR02543 family)
VRILSSGVQTVAAGDNHSLILKTDGSLWATGYNGFGQLGDGTTTTRTSPVRILSSGVQTVAAGDNHSLILKTDGSLWAMGSNGSGRLGDGTTTDRTRPVKILTSGVQGVCGGGSHSLFIWAFGVLSYHANGGSGSVASATVAAGAPQTVASGSGMTRSDYTFAGWNTAANGTGDAYAFGATIMVYADTILYAQWVVGRPPVISVPAVGQGALVLP